MSPLPEEFYHKVDDTNPQACDSYVSLKAALKGVLPSDSIFSFRVSEYCS